MKVSIKSKKENKPVEFMDIKDGTWVASLDPENTNKILICQESDMGSIINLKTGRPEFLLSDEELFNLVAVKITEINLEEV